MDNILKVFVVFFIACWFGMAMKEQQAKAKWDGAERRADNRRRMLTYRSRPNGRVIESAYDRRKNT